MTPEVKALAERVAWLGAVVAAMQHTIRTTEVIVSDERGHERIRLTAGPIYGSVAVTAYDAAGSPESVELYAADEMAPGDGTERGTRT
jgi:hypothetical protein